MQNETTRGSNLIIDDDLIRLRLCKGEDRAAVREQMGCHAGAVTMFDVLKRLGVLDLSRLPENFRDEVYVCTYVGARASLKLMEALHYAAK